MTQRFSLTSSHLLCSLADTQVTAVAHDNPIPGFDTRNCINLRLWAAKPSREFDLEAFNTGQNNLLLNALCLIAHVQPSSSDSVF